MGARATAHQLVGSVVPDELLRAIIDMSDDAIFTCDVNGTIATWSATAERLFGFLTEDAVDGPIHELFPDHLRQEARALIATVLAGDRIQHFETEVLRVDGMPMPVSLSLRPLRGADERRVGAVVIARDVTEQRLAQATLAEVEARLEEGEALGHVGTWLWDIRTGAVQWSAEFHRIHGVDPFAFDGTFESYIELVHSDDRQPIRAAMTQSVESGRTLEAKYRVPFQDGAVRIVQVRAQPTIGSAGTAVGLRGVGQDITGSPATDVSRGLPGA